MSRPLIAAMVGLTLCATASAQPDHIESVHQDLTIELDPAARALRGRAQITLQGGGRTRLALRADLMVQDLALDGEPLAQATRPRRRDAGMVARAEPAAPCTASACVTRGQLAAVPQAEHRDTLQELPPMAGATGSYLPAGTGWYPLIGEHQFTYRVDLELPPGQRGLVPGRLVAEQADAAGYRAQYEFSHPAEGIELMAGPYEVHERMMVRPGEQPVRLRTWFHPELHDLADEYLQAVEGYIRLYSDQIGAYPFGEFSVVSSPLPTGFGMPTLTYLGIDVLRLPFIKSTSLGHEVLHNWWGNGVYVDYERGNWCEGLTTFMADYFYKEQESAQAARAMRLDWLRDFAAVAPGQDFPLREFTARSHGTSQIVGYHKAAYVFLMLRDLLGPHSFDAGLRRFWREYRFRRASWDDLRRAFEQESGRSLSVFFAQWLDRAGAPELKITAAHARSGAGGLQVEVGIEQASPAYALQVPVGLADAATHRTELVAMGGLRETVSLDAPFRPESVTLDPRAASVPPARSTRAAAHPASGHARPEHRAGAGLVGRRRTRRRQPARGTPARCRTAAGYGRAAAAGDRARTTTWIACSPSAACRPGPARSREPAARRCGLRDRPTAKPSSSFPRATPSRCRRCSGRCRTMAGRAGWCSKAPRRSIAAYGRPRQAGLAGASRTSQPGPQGQDPEDTRRPQRLAACHGDRAH